MVWAFFSLEADASEQPLVLLLAAADDLGLPTLCACEVENELFGALAGIGFDSDKCLDTNAGRIWPVMECLGSRSRSVRPQPVGQC